MYQVENPVVIDSLWKHVVDFGRDVEIETQEVNLDIDTTDLTDEKTNALINDLENLSCNLGDILNPYYFKVDYDLPENGEGEKIYKIEVRGDEVPQEISEKIFWLLDDSYADYEEV